MQIVSRTSESFSLLDLDHWGKVKAARESAGIPNRDTRRGCILDHPLVGKQFEGLNGQRLVVESVKKDWMAGWFEVALLRDINSAPGVIDAAPPIRNLSSQLPGLDRSVEAFEQHYKAVNP